MAKNANLKFIAILGGIVGLIAILIGLFPSDASWWTIRTQNLDLAYYLNPFGFFTNQDNQTSPSIDSLILLSGLIFLAGSVLIIYGGYKESKGIALLSGILMIIALVLFCIVLNTKTNWGDVDSNLSFLDDQTNLLFGSISIVVFIILETVNWSLGIGFYVAAVGAGIGIIGAVVMK